MYVDEEFVGETNGTSLVRERTEHPRLLAIECKSDGKNDGFLVSLSNGYYTDASWKTTSALDGQNWTQTSFETTGWGNPLVIGRNADMPNDRSKQGGFDDDAKWLWSDDDTTGVIHHFRGIVGER